MIKQFTTAAVVGLASALAAGQSASVTVSSSSPTVAPGGSVTVSLQTTFDTAGAGAGLFGTAGFYGFGGTVTATGGAAGDLAGSTPALNSMLTFGPATSGGSGAMLASGAAGRGLSGGIAGDPGDLMTFTVSVSPSAAPGDVTLGFDGAVVLVLDSTLTTFSTDPGPNQQPLTTSSVTLTIGDAGCNDADLAEPFGILDLADISAFIAAFTGMQPAGDLDGSGVWDLTDISLFISAFTGGCP